jgi:hypothetical protein
MPSVACIILEDTGEPRAPVAKRFMTHPIAEQSSERRQWLATPRGAGREKPSSTLVESSLRLCSLAVLAGMPAIALLRIDPSIWLVRLLAESNSRLGLSVAGTLVACCGFQALIVLSVFAFIGVAAGMVTDRSRPGTWTSRWAPFPAVGLAWVADACVLYGYSGRVPPVGDLLPAYAASAFGVGLALATKRGRAALVNYTVAVTAVCGFGLVGAVFALSDVVPAVSDAPQMTENARRRLRQELKRITQRSDQPVRLVLTQDDVNLLATRWLDALSTKTRVDLQLVEGRLSTKASVVCPPLCLGTRYLNFDFQFEPTSGDASPRGLVLSDWHVGGITLPADWMLPAVRALSAVLSTRSGNDVLLAGVADCRFRSKTVELTVNPSDANAAALSPLEVGLAADERFADSVREYRDVLTRAIESAPAGDERFLYLLRTVFRTAQERTERGVDAGAAGENRAALTAFGILVGDPALTSMAGLQPENKIPGKRRKRLSRVTLRGRNDWARHFATSAALDVLASESVGRAAGLLKEEWDAGKGGSGFSFADLMADEAGLRFAAAAIRDDASAARIQQKLISGSVKIDDLFPPADGLPEGIPAARLRDHFGGVGGSGYQLVEIDLHQRLEKCGLLH